MDYLNQFTNIEFTHKLYGKAYLLPNSSFKKSDNPMGINYILANTVDIKLSSIDDCGINVDYFTLNRLGY